MKQIDNKIVFITGARKGIGAFLVRHFIDNGYLVEGCSRKKNDWSLKGYTHHIADVTDEAQIKSVFSSIRKRHGRLDIVINNAGVASMNHTLLTPFRVARQLVEINLCGTFLICRESTKLMKKRKYGRIINFSTVAVPMRLEGEAMYAASKSAVETFTKILARELSDFGITCNVVAPAPTKTDLIRGVPQKAIQKLINRLPVNRFGNFEDISNVIDFFIKPESDYVTGQVIYLGGA